MANYNSNQFSASGEDNSRATTQYFPEGEIGEFWHHQVVPAVRNQTGRDIPAPKAQEILGEAARISEENPEMVRYVIVATAADVMEVDYEDLQRAIRREENGPARDKLVYKLDTLLDAFQHTAFETTGIQESGDVEEEYFLTLRLGENTAPVQFRKTGRLSAFVSIGEAGETILVDDATVGEVQDAAVDVLVF